MGLLSTCWLLLPIFIHLGTVANAGKCTGRWAIHACGGGNGKRSDIDYPPSLADDSTAPEGRDPEGRDSEGRDPEGRDPEDDPRQLDLLTRLTRLSARNGAPAALDARRAEDELARRWAGSELMVDVGREGAGLGREGAGLGREGAGLGREGAGLGREGAESVSEERARLQAALRLIKRLLSRKASMLTSNQDSTD